MFKSLSRNVVSAAIQGIIKPFHGKTGLRSLSYERRLGCHQLSPVFLWLDTDYLTLSVDQDAIKGGSHTDSRYNVTIGPILSEI